MPLRGRNPIELQTPVCFSGPNEAAFLLVAARLSEKRGIDVTPGQHLTLNWGISQYLPLTKNQKLLLEVGPAGYDDWQITDDTGSAARNPAVHYQAHAVGGQVGLTYVPWKALLNFHAFHQFSTIDTLQGTVYGINLGIKF